MHNTVVTWVYCNFVKYLGVVMIFNHPCYAMVA
jgi:hypothetical protein